MLGLSHLSETHVKIEDNESRLKFYCNVDGMSAIDARDSQEGVLKMETSKSSEWELDRLVITLRHGDRTKLHTLKNTLDDSESGNDDDKKYIAKSVLNNLRAIR